MITKTYNEHAVEFVKYISKTFIIFGILTLILFPLSNFFIMKLIDYYAIEVYSLEPLDFIKTQFMFSIMISFILSLPIFIITIYNYCKEFIKINKIYLYITLIYLLGIFGFGIGLIFTSKLILNSLLNLIPITTLWSISSVSFIVFSTSLLIAFSFQLLVIIPFLMKLGIINYNQYHFNRKYFIMGLVVLLALLTPDTTMFSTSILAIPVFCCVEGGFFLGKQITKEEKKNDWNN
jgi:sec-independent protein translocase protein TatC